MLVVSAPAKLNLALEVVARRDDGWHDIDSILVPIDWHDLVGVAMRPSQPGGGGASLRVSGPARAGVPRDETNLASRAAQLLAHLTGKPVDFDVWVDKRVPHAAGLGGGSADAAAVLRAGSRLLESLDGGAISRDRLADIAMRIGSDVPALLDGGVERVRGRGEQLESLAAEPMHVVVAVAGQSSTAATYAGLAASELGSDGRAARLATVLNDGSAVDDELLGSALEPAALRASPSLAVSLQNLRIRAGTHRWHLTGSGGAVFCVVADGTEAASLAAEVTALGVHARACRTLQSRRRGCR